jgi:hypothetical protein
MVVERSRVGPVSIGAAAESIYREFGDRARLIDLKLEGMLSPALELKLFGSQPVASLIAEIGPADNRLVVTRGLDMGVEYHDRAVVRWAHKGVAAELLEDGDHGLHIGVSHRYVGVEGTHRSLA